MNGWHPIEPEPQCLTESEQAVKKLLDRGWSYPMIAIKLHMSHETTRDIIFEIRKKEGIMRKPTITDEEKQTMKRMFAEGKTINEIADATGRGRSSVYRIVYDRKAAQINPEFEAATNEMIAELRKDKCDAAELEDVENGIPNTPLIAANAEQKFENTEQKFENAKPDKLPGVVCRAIDAGFHDLADEIDKRRNRIEELKAEIAEFEKDIDALRQWREAHP